ncbi:methyltransferase domain-containing protein [Dichotomicrobium thermohalophilum]|uniref:Methyltransferase family protein n=1 Tax=Dichotomicrobium thermohalophilum TaxID=933063 RepID=A0A397Q4L9_9HYPH|nr:methyltransferase domain-containing protein [Dichotomicrobium thermohalophilum]RIA55359.1 methyltransferase family protein [Dichotomicrobium thermohalophilum]
MTSPSDLFDRKMLARQRNRAAQRIGAHDFLLHRAAEDIVERLGVIQRAFPVAVNVGAHHGVLSRALVELESVGTVISVEESPALLRQCPAPRVRADMEMLPFGGEKLDLVVSALALQFANDLPGTLVQIRRALKPDGLFLGALLGGATLQELRAALMAAETEITGGAAPRVAPMADVRDFGGLLQRTGFNLPVSDTDVVQVSYETPFALMHELRGMGAVNALRERSSRPLRRDVLMRAAEIYADHYGIADGRVSATFEIITLTGWAPHESQQKPLRPGSAQARLADALGTEEHSAGDKANPGPVRNSD